MRWNPAARAIPCAVLALHVGVCPAALPGEGGTAEAGQRRGRPGQVFRDCAFCPEMVVVRSGRFRMGCVSGADCFGDERPVHEVRLSAFALSRSEVRFDEYDHFAAATGRERPGR